MSHAANCIGHRVMTMYCVKGFPLTHGKIGEGSPVWRTQYPNREPAASQIVSLMGVIFRKEIDVNEASHRLSSMKLNWMRARRQDQRVC